MLNTFIDYFFAALKLGGIIYAGWNMFQLGTSLNHHDSSTIKSSILGIIGGAVILAAGIYFEAEARAAATPLSYITRNYDMFFLMLIWR